jgi:hypothetical protein
MTFRIVVWIAFLYVLMVAILAPIRGLDFAAVSVAVAFLCCVAVIGVTTWSLWPLLRR